MLYKIHNKQVSVISQTHQLSEMTFGLTKGGTSRNILTHNIIWANQKTKSFVHLCLCTHAKFDVTAFFAFVGPSNVVSSILLIS